VGTGANLDSLRQGKYLTFAGTESPFVGRPVCTLVTTQYAVMLQIFFSVPQQRNAGPARLIVVVSRFHTIRRTDTHTHTHTRKDPL
jgi:hypothetical protein